MGFNTRDRDFEHWKWKRSQEVRELEREGLALTLIVTGAKSFNDKSFVTNVLDRVHCERCVAEIRYCRRTTRTAGRSLVACEFAMCGLPRYSGSRRGAWWRSTGRTGSSTRPPMRGSGSGAEPPLFMVTPARFERAAFPLGGGRSIQLSYGAMAADDKGLGGRRRCCCANEHGAARAPFSFRFVVERRRIELPTSALRTQRSPS